MLKFVRNNLKFIVAVVTCITATSVSAQDPHFTQFYGTPLHMNPAMTGVFDGTFRLSNNYRTQWSGLGGGYKTIHISADAPIAKGELGSNYFGVGFLLYQDKAGTAGFRSTIIEGSLSYTAALDPEKSNYISLGFQAGLNQQSLDLSKATWDSQWNGDAFDPALPSRESIQLQQFSYLDLNAGFMYFHVPDEFNSFSFGAAMHHIGSPNVSFFSEGEAPLRRRITVNTGAEISLNKENMTWLIPKAYFMLQGKQKEIMFGGFVKNKIQFKSRYTNYKKEAYFYLGGFYRWDDAIALAARVEYNMFGLGLSYDINTSYLSSLTGSSSAFEINLSYIAYVKRGQRAKHFSKTPRFF